ncbi:MAG: tetratricopeptide repeat protein [Bacteroidota bacterium]|nr:tetratricopeptide repeat protein [Bacteroidota bacterium]
MRRKAIFFLAAFSLFGFIASAQPNKVTDAWNYMSYKEWEKAKLAIDAASVHEKTANSKDTWLYKGIIYANIYRDSVLNSKYPEALEEAHKAFIKAAELDKISKRPDRELAAHMVQFGIDLYNEGIMAYNQGNYERSSHMFSKYSEIAKSLGPGRADLDRTLMSNRINPLLVYLYTGQSADSMKNYEVAKRNYNVLISNNDTLPYSYLALARIQKIEKDTGAALATLQKGMTYSKEKQNLLIEQINIYMKQGKTDEAIRVGESAIKLDSTNYTLYLAMGGFYKSANRLANADRMYQKSISVDPGNANAYQALGLLYYNQGVDIYNEAKGIKDYKKAGEKRDEAKAVWSKALPYLERSHELNTKDAEVIDVMARIYAQLGDVEKSNYYRSKLK